jgi:hypothetical protein
MHITADSHPETRLIDMQDRLIPAGERGIVILGMHRSGTSLVANLVRQWGAYFGEDGQILPANKWNEAGHWEFEPLVRFNRKLLAQAGAATFVPPRDGAGAELEASGSRGPMRDAALRLVAGMAGHGGAWAWKDPQLALLLRFWEKVWTAPVYLVVVRHPLSVAESLCARDGFPASAALLLWQRHMQCILKAVRNAPERSFFVEYEALLESPAARCSDLSSFLETAIPLTRGENRLSAMCASVQGRLDHSSKDRGALTADQRRLYEVIREAAATQRVPELLEDEIQPHPCWRDYLTCWHSIEDVSMRCRAIRRQLREINGC